MNSRYSILPEDLISKGINLESLGILEFGWKKTDALKVIEFVSENGHVILGGDVYKYENNVIDSTYDSWYTDDLASNNYKYYIEESKKMSYEYICEYAKNNGDCYIYSIIF